MKKLLSALTAVVIALSFCSCGILRPLGQSDTDTAAPDAAQTSAVPDSAQGTRESGGSSTDTKEPEAEEKRLSFVGCGDNIVYYGNVREAAAVAQPGGRQYNFAPTYSQVAPIVSAADISFINQETLMAGEGWDFSYYPTFNGPQDMGYDLVDLGYDVVSIANNHMLDKGGAGLEATVKFWKSMNVLMIGGYESEDDYNAVRILEKDGVKIAFLSYTYGTNGITLGSGYNVVIPYLDEATVKSQIENARTQADFVFVSAHWGIEDHFTPSDEQKKYARIMADAGADVILGHHPHVIQPVEWISAEDGRKTLCVYSLGNFMAEQAYDYNMIGGMISFDIVTKGDTRSIENPVFIPTVYYFDTSFYGNCIYLLENFTAAQAASHGIAAYGHYTNLETLRKYVTDTVSPEFLPESFK